LSGSDVRFVSRIANDRSFSNFWQRNLAFTSSMARSETLRTGPLLWSKFTILFDIMFRDGGMVQNRHHPLVGPHQVVRISRYPIDRHPTVPRDAREDITAVSVIRSARHKQRWIHHYKNRNSLTRRFRSYLIYIYCSDTCSKLVCPTA